MDESKLTILCYTCFDGNGEIISSVEAPADAPVQYAPHLLPYKGYITAIVIPDQLH